MTKSFIKGTRSLNFSATVREEEGINKYNRIGTRKLAVKADGMSSFSAAFDTEKLRSPFQSQLKP